MKRGLVLGKFLPPHTGHLHLVRFAQAMCEELDVVVGSLAAEPIPGELRLQWMRALLPGANVLHLTDENPSAPEEHPRFWELWKASLTRILPAMPTHVFASEEYGARLASELGATWIPLDRMVGPLASVNGTAIRLRPEQHWEHLPPLVRPYFQERVHVVGPESTGKSTLARALAESLSTSWVPEYARTWLERKGNPRDANGTCEVRASDLPVIAAAHAASANAIAPYAGPTLILDTDALTTSLWSMELFGAVDPAVVEAARRETPALTLLCDVDIEWERDAVRYRPNEVNGERRAFFSRFKHALEREGRPFAVIRGKGDERTEAALRAVRKLQSVRL